MEQESFLSGGVTLTHSVVDGMHRYEVAEVFTSKPSDFGRKGDKLLMINDVETRHLPPKKFVRMLSSGSLRLTVHRAGVEEGEEEVRKCPESESMRPYHKERTVLNFSLDMVREERLDEGGEDPPALEASDRRESGEGESVPMTDEELLLVSMTNTSVAIVRARGCDGQNPCSSCGGSGCSLDDFVFARKQCTISSVFKGYIKKNVERGQVLIQSLLQRKISPENVRCSSNAAAAAAAAHRRSSASANVTIYFYLSNAQEDFDKGAPVVLNFSGSANFLKCVRESGGPLLTVECCEKSKLQSICKEDPDTWPFVFYLKTTKDDHRRFESAAHPGWFIHTKPSGAVCMGTGSSYSESHFYVIVHLGNE